MSLDVYPTLFQWRANVFKRWPVIETRLGQYLMLFDEYFIWIDTPALESIPN